MIVVVVVDVFSVGGIPGIVDGGGNDDDDDNVDVVARVLCTNPVKSPDMFVLVLISAVVVVVVT